MSKIARLASIVERAEKQALVLFIKESKQNDNTAVAMLKKRGVPEPEKVLELLKEITVDGTENGKTVWDISKTGKEIQPLAGWFCSTWNNDDLVQARERVADTVHKMYRIPSARNADLMKVWMANKELTDYEEWVNKAYEQDKAKGLIADAENGEKVNVGAYEFPKKMLAYSDKYVDCYRADTPADAMLLGNGYPFCISRRDGSNMFYSYRMNPTTTAYFCWFKDENGNKTKKNMVVVHVGEDDRYMVTKSENGSFPRDSRATTIKKYPALKGAIESGKLIVVPMSDEEKEVRQKYNYRSFTTTDDIKGKSPKYIELVLAQGVRLNDDAFEYIFNEIDKGNLRTGNNGNSLIKKYVESGIHRLTDYQNELLEKAGYGGEVIRALEVYFRGHIAAGRVLSDEDFDLILNKIDKGVVSSDTLIGSYVMQPNRSHITDRQEKVIASLPGGAAIMDVYNCNIISRIHFCNVKVLKSKIVITPKNDEFKLGEILSEHRVFFNRLNKPISIVSSKKSSGCEIFLVNVDDLVPKVSFAGFKEHCYITYTWHNGIKGSCNYLDFPKNIYTFKFIVSENNTIISGIPTVECERGKGLTLREGIRIHCPYPFYPEIERFDIDKKPNSLSVSHVRVKSLEVLGLPDRMDFLKLEDVEVASFLGIPKDRVDILNIVGYSVENVVDYLPKEIGKFTCVSPIKVSPKDVTITDFNREQSANVSDVYWLAQNSNETDYQATYMKEHYTHSKSKDNMRVTMEEVNGKYVVTTYELDVGLYFFGKADKPIVFSNKSISRKVYAVGSFVILEGLPENTEYLYIGTYNGAYIKELPESIDTFYARNFVYGVEKLLELPKLKTVIFDVARGSSGVYTKVYTSILGISVAEFKKSYEDVIEKLRRRGVLVTVYSATADWLYYKSNESLSLSQLGWALNSIID